jgi:serine/threonine-protein kinase HipA
MKDFSAYSSKELRLLFDGKKVSPFLDFSFDDLQAEHDMVDAMHRISVSGVQEKFPAIVDHGKIRIASKEERSTHILKPAPWDRTLQSRKQIPANEHLTMQVASQVYGIVTASNGICIASDGQPVYITRRFDITADGEKLGMEDLATVIGNGEQKGGTYFKYNGCYEDIAVAIRKNVAAWKPDMERFFELVLFNYIYGNDDDHLKNFSLIRQGNDYRLAPAYDLLNTQLHVNGGDWGLEGGLSPHIEVSDVMARTGHPCRLDFERFGDCIGLAGPRLNKVLNKYVSMPEETENLVMNSFLNEKMKRSYLRIVNERIHRYVRKSED